MRWPISVRILIGVLVASILCTVGRPSPAHAARVGPAVGTLSAVLNATVVRFGFSGFEPDFDPIDRVIIAGSLRGMRSVAGVLPDTMIVLSTYLENFQPDTTPILPDLLHPNQVATSLGGFLQGKVALVNAAGQISFRGSLLAEVFLDNSVHLVLDLRRSGAADTVPWLRLEGTFMLNKDLTVHGQIVATRGLTHAEVAALGALGAPRGHPLAWQTVVQELAVHVPPMMGTAGTGTRPQATARLVVHSAALPGRAPGMLSAHTIALLLALGAALLGTVAWRLNVVDKRRRSALSAGPTTIDERTI